MTLCRAVHHQDAMMHVSASVIVFSYRSELGQGQEKEEHSGSALQQHSLREKARIFFFVTETSNQ
jgi:hypothetical protein